MSETPTNPPQTDDTAQEQRTMIGNLAFGLRVWWREIRWLLLGGLRGMELRQMRRQLDAEYAGLGRAVAKALGDADLAGDKEQTVSLGADDLLHLRQIRFLKDELGHLEKERDDLRETYGDTNTKA